MSQRTRIGALLSALVLLTAVSAVYCATATAEEDAWDTSGMRIGHGGIYGQGGLYYDWCGPQNTLRAMNDEGLAPQYNVDRTSWVPFAGSVTFTVGGGQGSLHTIGARYVDSQGDPASAAGEYMLYMALDTTGPASRAFNAVKVRRYHAAEFRFRVGDRGSRKDVVRIVVKTRSGRRVASYLVGPTRINHPATCRKKISLPRGRYRWFVTAVDRTGNAQVHVGRNRLVVY